MTWLDTDMDKKPGVIAVMDSRSGTVSRGHITWSLLVMASTAVMCPGCVLAFLQSPCKYLIAVYLRIG